jgi:hypothetical protein
VNDRLGDGYIVVAVIDADGKDVLGRVGNSASWCVCVRLSRSHSGRQSGGQGNREVIVFCQRVRKLPNRFEVLPPAGIHGVLGAVNGRGDIPRLERGLELAGFDFSLESRDHGRSGIDDKVIALLSAGQPFARRVLGGVAGGNLQPVAAVGQQRGIEGEIPFPDPGAQQLPVRLAIAANVNVEK